VLVLLEIVIGGNLEQLPEALLVVAQRAFGFDLGGDVLGHAAVTTERTIVAQDRDGAGHDAHDATSGELMRVDQPAQGLPRPDRFKGNRRRPAVNLRRGMLVYALSEHLRHRDAVHRLEVLRDKGEAAGRIVFPIPLGCHLQQLPEAPLAVAQRAFGLDRRGDVEDGRQTRAAAAPLEGCRLQPHPDNRPL
jgi:hypothetical protein